MRSKVRSNPMHLHPALQLQDQYASYHRTTYQAPNLASFAIAAAAAGLVTALYFELQVGFAQTCALQCKAAGLTTCRCMP